MLKHKLVDFVIQFLEEVDKEISEIKLFVCLRAPLHWDTISNQSSLMHEHDS
jgi:hypothetical protein